MRSADLFARYVSGLGSLLGASGVSVYVPAERGAPGTGLLAHDGPAPPLPELLDAAAAAGFAFRVAPEIQRRRNADPELSVVEVASTAPQGRLLGILPRAPARVPDRRQAARPALARGGLGGSQGTEVWLGMTDGPPRLDPGWGALLAFAGELARHAHRVSQILDDPVTGLPGRVEFQVDVERALESALEHDLPLTLLMVNPDDFLNVNARITRAAGDQVIREIALRLHAAHRSSDRVARYGGVVFAAILPYTAAAEGRRRAEQVLEELQAKPFLDGTVSLRFSVGLASREAGDQDVGRVLDLIRRADAALRAAKLAGGGRLVAWEPVKDDEGQLDRLTGIFTGQMAKDYRNMAVLSDTISVLALAVAPSTLAERVVRGLLGSFKPDRAGLFDLRGGEAPQLIYGTVRSGTATDPAAFVLNQHELGLIEAARQRGQPVELREIRDEVESLAFAVPLVAGEDALGVLYLAGHPDSMSLDSSDLVFLGALATQVAVALDRAWLSERQRQREEQERSKLLAEVDELRSALKRSRILYRSGQMETLMERVRRVAPTDATVLITGESGTGKEVFARAVHELSRRRDQPFVVVDCGAIPTTLIESELFGHEKGAFTGAQQREGGRLLQADRGTLLLDEIGELPIETQSRLLRFVQDKQVTPVGGRTTRVLDVRVLAATNRDLPAEVEGGRFRADLYHRLNVVRMEIPPLRARPEDVSHLAEHFCRMYSVLYARPAFSFSPEAEAALLRHPWPGNVRELQNRVMRAVILAQGSALTPEDLGLDGGSTAPFAVPQAWPVDPLEEGQPSAPQRPALGVDVWTELRALLRREIEQALANPPPLPPLGRWLGDDLVLEAHRLGDGVGSRGARFLGIPATTFRRKLEMSVARTGGGWSAPRPAGWSDVRTCLARVLRAPEETAGEPIARVERLLVEEVLARLPETPRAGAALLGVSLPTFRRRCDEVAPQAGVGSGG